MEKNHPPMEKQYKIKGGASTPTPFSGTCICYILFYPWISNTHYMINMVLSFHYVPFSLKFLQEKILMDWLHLEFDRGNIDG